TEVTITEITNYPFDDKITLEIVPGAAVSFPLHLRIPAWCESPSVAVDGEAVPGVKPGAMAVIDREWKSKTIVTLSLPMKVTTSSWAKNSRAIERGPLVYALKLNERWEKGTEPKEGDYFSVYPTEDWNYGLLQEVVKDPEAGLVAHVKPMPEKFAWNLHNAPVEIVARGRKIPAWKAVNGVAHQPVTDREGIYKGDVAPEISTFTLIPYGCTKVRIVAFPVVR
ncbi:MAG TPA: hypothetical protein VEB86_17135, partial [Chryseosolibacter sp.]|nr:hypothetical protein [Chryseosolibacter sp.]